MWSYSSLSPRATAKITKLKSLKDLCTVWAASGLSLWWQLKANSQVVSGKGTRRTAILHNFNPSPKTVNRKSFLLCLVQAWLIAASALRDVSWATCFKCVSEEELPGSEIAPGFLGSHQAEQGWEHLLLYVAAFLSPPELHSVTLVTWVFAGKDGGYFWPGAYAKLY